MNSMQVDGRMHSEWPWLYALSFFRPSDKSRLLLDRSGAVYWVVVADSQSGVPNRRRKFPWQESS